MFRFDKTATIAMVTLFFVTATSTLGRTVADSLFLSYFDRGDLSKIYLPQALLLFVTAIIYQKLSEKLRLDQLAYRLMGFAVLFSFACFPLVQVQKNWVIPIIYISYDAFNFLSLILSWQLITATLDPRIAKQKISSIGSGSLMGGIVSGITLRNYSHLVDIKYLMLIYASLQIILIICFYLLKKSSMVHIGKAHQKSSVVSRKVLFQKIPHLGQISMMMGALTVSLTLLDFQFKFLLSQNIPKPELPVFMGSYYAVTGVLALIIQLIFTSVVIRKVGLTSVLLLLPVILCLGSTTLFFLPILSIAVFLKGSDRVIGDTLHSSAMQLLMFPIEGEYRNSAKAFLDGSIRNGSKAIAACLLMVFGFFQLPIQVLASLVMILVSISIFAAFRMRKTFLQTLIQSIDDHQLKEEDFTLTELDGTSSRILINALKGEDQLHALSALKFLKNFPKFDLLPYLPKLLASNHPQIQIEALKYVQLNPKADFKPIIFQIAQAYISEEDIFKTNELVSQQSYGLENQSLLLKTSLKAEAILTIASYCDENDLDFFSYALKSPSYHIKNAAVTALVKNFGLEGMFRCVETLKKMLQSPNVGERALVASLFGKLNIEEFYQPLIPLLKDEDLSVRLMALSSCAQLKVPQLIPHIKELLKSPITRNQCAQTLSIYPEETLIDYLKHDWQNKEFAHNLPSVWQYFKSEEAVRFILGIYHQANEEYKTTLAKVMVQMNQKSFPFPFDQTSSEIFKEVKIFHIFKNFLNLINQLPIEERNLFAFIEEGINRDCNQCLRRIFYLLSLVYSTDLIEKAFMHLKEEDDFLDQDEHTSTDIDQSTDLQTQANSLEILEQILSEPIRTQVLSLFDNRFQNQHAHTALSQLEHQIDQKFVQVFEVSGLWLKDCMIHLLQQEKGRFPNAEQSLKSFIELGQIKANQQIELVQLLNQVALFKSLSNEEKSLMALQLVKCAFEPNEVILEQYDRGDYLLILAKGEVVVEKGGMEICSLGVGACFGETALIDAGARTATVRSKTQTILWRLDSNSFFEILFDRNDMSMMLMKLLAQRLRLELSGHTQNQDTLSAKQAKDHLNDTMAPTQSSIFSKELSDQIRQKFLEMTTMPMEPALAIQQQANLQGQNMMNRTLHQQMNDGLSIHEANLNQAQKNIKSQSIIYEEKQKIENHRSNMMHQPQLTPLMTPSYTLQNQSKDLLLIEKMHRILLLQNIPLFSFLNLQELTLLSSKVEERKFKKGDLICIEGQKGNGMYGVIRGKISVQKNKAEVAVLDSGDFFGEMSLIDHSPRVATCEALEDATLLYIKRKTVFTFCFERPDALREMMRVLVRRLRILESKNQ